MTVADLLKIIRRHFPLLLAATLICALLGVGYAQFSPSSKQYTATATAYLEITTSKDWDPDNQKDVTPLSYTSARNNTIRPLFTSYETVKQALANLGLDDDIETVQENITLKHDVEQLTTEVTVEMDTPEAAKDLANELIDIVAEQVKEIEGEDSPYVLRILTPATETTTLSSGISVKKMALLGTGAGLFLGFVLAILLWTFDRRIRTVADLDYIVSAPVLASFAKDADLDNTDSIRRLRAHIAKLDSGTPVVIASARDEENTAPLSIALAHSLAKADHKEVLVDTNPQAKVSHTLELTNKKGLSDILKKNTDIATSITSLNGIDVIPAGTTSEALSDLLATTAITDTINHLDTYRVICDGAGVLDSSTLMSLGEIPRTHAILVAYANQTTLSDAQQSALLLEESGFEILGTVLMDLDTSTYARLRYGNPELLEDFTRKGLASHAA